MLKLLRRFTLLEIASNISSRTKCTNPLRMSVSNTNLDLEVDRIVWIDMEMTGLDIENDKIMEVACLITDSELNVIAEGPDLIVHQPKEVLDNMNDWCKNQHGKTGLTEACQKATTSIVDAEKTLLDFVQQYTTHKSSPLAGNSVYMDRIFLAKFMKSVNDHLHYRIIDVSSIKEVCRRWNLEVYRSQPKKEFSHRALNDIRESIKELKFYKENFFKTSMK